MSKQNFSLVMVTLFAVGCGGGGSPVNSGPNGAAVNALNQPENYNCLRLKATLETQVAQDRSSAQAAFSQETASNEALFKDIMQSLNQDKVLLADIENLGAKLGQKFKERANNPKYQVRYKGIHEKLLAIVNKSMANISGSPRDCIMGMDDTKVPVRVSHRLHPGIDLTIRCAGAPVKAGANDFLTLPQVQSMNGIPPMGVQPMGIQPTASAAEQSVYFVANDKESHSPMLILTRTVKQPSAIQKNDTRYTLEVPIHLWYSFNSRSSNGETAGRATAFQLRNQTTQDVEFFWVDRADRKFQKAINAGVLPRGCTP